MSIATELEELNDDIIDAYAAVSAKGGTVPAQKNMDNLDTAIASIPSGGSSQLLYGKIKYHPYAQLPARIETTAGTITNQAALISYMASIGFPGQYGPFTAEFNWTTWQTPNCWQCWSPVLQVTNADFEANGFTPPSTSVTTTFTMTYLAAGQGVDTSTTLEYEFQSSADAEEIRSRMSQPNYSMAFDNGNLMVDNEQLKEIMLGAYGMNLYGQPNFITPTVCPYYAGSIPVPPDGVYRVDSAYNLMQAPSMSGFDISFPNTIEGFITSFQQIHASGTIRLPSENVYGDPIVDLVSTNCLFSETSACDAYQQGITIITGDATATANLIANLPHDAGNNRYRNLINGDL